MKIVKKIILAATVCTAIIAAIGCTKNESSTEVKEVRMMLVLKMVIYQLLQ